ncbi:DUF1372 family protein [Streptococcus iniae]|uniref:DUF1372 family protein n=1 Tax=Streptococcus iniae TaxID=1346 RepID=UPI001605271D|nr:DUF1372 family protein [Streptococcus iniae]
MKKVIKLLKHIANTWILISISVLPTLILMQVNEINNKPAKNQQVNYVRDSVGSPGTISAINGNTVSVVGYGKFIVTDDELGYLQVGDKAPNFLLERGS